MKKNRFLLQRSETVENRLVCTDTENQIACTFEFGRYNETQKFTFLDEEKIKGMNASDIARIMREFGEFLAVNHYFSAMPFDNDACRAVVARKIKTEREKKGWSIYQLSKESGVQINHISRIEQGLFSARYDTIEKLLHAIGKSLAVV